MIQVENEIDCVYILKMNLIGLKHFVFPLVFSSNLSLLFVSEANEVNDYSFCNILNFFILISNTYFYA